MEAREAQDLTDALAQGPQLFIVEVGVSLNALAGRKGVCQEPVLAIEGVPISVLWRSRWRRRELAECSCAAGALPKGAATNVG